VDSQPNMYAEAKTWNPFKGCEFGCTYCVPSFQRQSKRQKSLCMDCYNYTPHCHKDRLKKIPSARIVFVCGNADISFCPDNFTLKILEQIVDHNKRAPHKTYFFQSKRPAYFGPFLSKFPDNVILLTTLETNRDEGYSSISKAPCPSDRYRQFRALDYPRKVVTVEPLLDFDLDIFASWIENISPEYVWLGFNSKPESVALPEPSEEKAQQFGQRLGTAGIKIRGKTLRGVTLPQTCT
jgi:DNA repair photolyase